MGNLFQRNAEEQGGLAAALLLLLEHSDRELLSRFLQLAGVQSALEKGASVTAQFPLPDGPPGVGRLEGPQVAVTIAARGPGETWPIAAPPDEEGEMIAITPDGAPLPGFLTLSWEQVERWLAAMAEKYSPESRTGFLLAQFRSLLPEAGIITFAGFSPALLEQAPGALASLTEFYQTSDQLFDRLAPGLTAPPRELTPVRQARPEDLLAGYTYRDYTGPGLGEANFLRVAFHLAQRELQFALWLTPPAIPDLTSGHSRLREELRSETGLLEGLRSLEAQPLLRLWSASGELLLPLDELQPERLEAVDWASSHVAVQRSLPFDRFPETGLVGRVTTLADELIGSLAPILAPTLH